MLHHVVGYHALMVALFNNMKNGYHCWAEWTKAYSQKTGEYQFYCNKGRH